MKDTFFSGILFLIDLHLNLKIGASVSKDSFLCEVCGFKALYQSTFLAKKTLSIKSMKRLQFS